MTEMEIVGTRICKKWKFSESEFLKIGIWKMSWSEMIRIGNFKNWTLSEFEIGKIGNYQNYHYAQNPLKAA